MLNCWKNLRQVLVLGVAAGALTGGLAPPASYAADRTQPTFLESGSNDLIRFQRGSAPDDEPAAEEPAPLSAPSPAPAAEKPVAKKIQVFRGSRLEPTASQSSDLAVQSAPKAMAPPVPQADAAEAEASVPDTALTMQSESPIDAEIDARLVTVCLNNPQDAAGAKAFDIRRDGPPRYVADIGGTACARFEPTRHTLYFWKAADAGQLSLILSSRLDLNGADGTQVSLDWLRDR
jgi:hypothetical protein